MNDRTGESNITHRSNYLSINRAHAMGRKNIILCQ